MGILCDSEAKQLIKEFEMDSQQPAIILVCHFHQTFQYNKANLTSVPTTYLFVCSANFASVVMFQYWHQRKQLSVSFQIQLKILYNAIRIVGAFLILARTTFDEKYSKSTTTLNPEHFCFNSPVLFFLFAQSVSNGLCTRCIFRQMLSMETKHCVFFKCAELVKYAVNPQYL